MADLKPCPFCGSEDIYETYSQEYAYGTKNPEIFCNTCKAIFSIEDDSPYMDVEKDYEYRKEKTAEAWNRRAMDLPSAQPEQRWIPCSERLPYAEDGNSSILLVTCGYKNVEDTSIRWLRRLWFDGEYWNDVDGERYNQIVYAWMPLPKPYKGETDG